MYESYLKSACKDGPTEDTLTKTASITLWKAILAVENSPFTINDIDDVPTKTSIDQGLSISTLDYWGYYKTYPVNSRF